MTRDQMTRTLVAVRGAEHRKIKAVAARKGLKMGALVSDILKAWYDGEVYVCPSRRVATTPQEG